MNRTPVNPNQTGEYGRRRGRVEVVECAQGCTAEQLGKGDMRVLLDERVEQFDGLRVRSLHSLRLPRSMGVDEPVRFCPFNEFGDVVYAPIEFVREFGDRGLAIEYCEQSEFRLSVHSVALVRTDYK